MSRKQNWYVRRYVRAVSGFLPCSGKVEIPELLKALRSRRRVVLTVLAGVIAALAVWLAVCMVSLRDYHQAVNGYVETAVTEVDN